MALTFDPDKQKSLANIGLSTNDAEALLTNNNPDPSSITPSDIDIFIEKAMNAANEALKNNGTINPYGKHPWKEDATKIQATRTQQAQDTAETSQNEAGIDAITTAQANLTQAQTNLTNMQLLATRYREDWSVFNSASRTAYAQIRDGVKEVEKQVNDAEDEVARAKKQYLTQSAQKLTDKGFTFDDAKEFLQTQAAQRNQGEAAYPQLIKEASDARTKQASTEGFKPTSSNPFLEKDQAQAPNTGDQSKTDLRSLLTKLDTAAGKFGEKRNPTDQKPVTHDLFALTKGAKNPRARKPVFGDAMKQNATKNEGLSGDAFGERVRMAAAPKRQQKPADWGKAPTPSSITSAGGIDGGGEMYNNRPDFSPQGESERHSSRPASRQRI